jgi:hypothetical protein
MKLITLLIAFSILLGGCARKSELETARENLAEAQRKIEALENERVPRVQYDATRASLKNADDRIVTLERELSVAQEQLATQEKVKSSGEGASPPEANTSERPLALGMAKGAYVLSNETYVYSPDAQLNFGSHLQISSPTGLMVSDPEQKIVGGDLSIKAKGMMLETSDGLLTTTADGSVKFTGKTLTMKFEDKAPAPEKPADVPPPTNTNTPQDVPATTAPLPAATSSP